MIHRLTTGNPPVTRTIAEDADLPDIYAVAQKKLTRITRWRQIALARVTLAVGRQREAIIATLPIQAAA